MIDSAFDGINCRVLRNKAAERMLKKRFPLLDSLSAALFMKREPKLSWPQLIRMANSLRHQPIGIGEGKRGMFASMRLVTGGRLFVKATVEGDVENGLLLTGQGAGRIHDIPTVAELIERTIREAEEIVETLKTRIGS